MASTRCARRPQADHLSPTPASFNAASSLQTDTRPTVDQNTIPIFNNNLVKAIINDHTRLMMLVDTGASVTCLSYNFLNIIRQSGQRCVLYKCEDKPLTSINGSSLHILGQVFVRVRLAQFLLRIPVYVISNMDRHFVLGNDTLAKYRMIVDYEKQHLYVKSNATVYLNKDVTVPPNSSMQICCRSFPSVAAGVVGQIFQKPALCRSGISAMLSISTVQPDQLIYYQIKNNSDKPVTLKRNSRIGYLCALNQRRKRKYTPKPTSYSNNQNLPSVDTENNMNDNDFDIPDCIHKDRATASEINSIQQHSALQFDLSKTTLNSEEKSELIKILNLNRDVFSTGPYDLGELKGAEFTITLLPGAKPFRSRPYRASPKQREIIDQQIADLLKADVIEECNGVYASPALIVEKHDEHGRVSGHRLCVDLRQLNAQIQPNIFPLPLISDMIDSMGGARYFSVIDCAQGYHQIRVAEDSRDYTGFVTHSGLWRYKRLPFGISTAPSYFSSKLSELFRKLLYKGVMVYIDDIIVSSTCAKSHLELLQEVFSILRKANLKIKASKCKFAVSEVKFLGHILSAEGVQADPAKLKVVKEYETPKNIKTLRAFLGLTNYFRRFIPNYSRIAQPLTKLLKVDTPFVWSDDCQTAFEALKEKLISPPIVAYPNYSDPFLLYTDASGKAISGILSQIQDTASGPQERVIAFFARNMLPAEVNYNTHERELLAIYYSLLQAKSYIEFSRVDIITDCKALCEIVEKRPVSARLGKWLYFMNQFSYKMRYRPGSRNHADGLSRIKHKSVPKPEEGEPPIGPCIDAIIDLNTYLTYNAPNTTVVPALTWPTPAHMPSVNAITTPASSTTPANMPPPAARTLAAAPTAIDDVTAAPINLNTDNTVQPYGETLTLDLLRTEQLLDRDLKFLIDYLQTSVLPKDDKIARKISLQSAYYSYADGLLYHHQKQRNKSTDNINIQLVIPKNLRLPILQQFHDHLGHRATDNVYKLIVKKYFWDNMFKDCYDHVHSCHVCMRHQHLKKKDRSPLSPIPVQDHPFANWFVDCVGPLKETANHNKYILTCVDSFSKWIEIIPLPNITSYTLAKAIFERIICRFGSFKIITTDLGKSLCSAMFDHLITMCGGKHLKSAAYHHQSLGQVEVMNQVVERMLAKLVNEEQNNWDSYLPTVQLAHNISESSATGHAPYLIVYGREVSLPLDIALSKPNNLNIDTQQELSDLIQHVTKLDKLVKLNINNTQAQIKGYYDKKSTPVTLNVGDLVWLYIFVHPKHLAGKLKCSWTGPFRIISFEGKNFRLRRVSDNVELPIPVNVDRLQKVYDRHIRPPIPLILPSQLSPALEDKLAESLTSAETDLQLPGSLDCGPDTGVAPQLPRSIDPVIDRAVHSVPKARTENGQLEYYIIYEDQLNKNAGTYIPECKLTVTEKCFIEQNKDKIRFMRKANKILPDHMYAIFNRIGDVFSSPTSSQIVNV